MIELTRLAEDRDGKDVNVLFEIRGTFASANQDGLINKGVERTQSLIRRYIMANNCHINRKES
jgi:hypothetical protein